MKRIILWLAGVCALAPVSAQDIILLRDASEIEARVTEIDDTDVVYRRFGDSIGPLHRIARADVFAITYANGEREAFSEENSFGTARYPLPPVSRSYAVGDLFDEGGVTGIVIHTTDGGRHGVLLSLNSADLAFVSPKERDLAEITIGLSDTQDGWQNLLVMERFVQEKGLSWSSFPAYEWCRSLGPGWYLPAVDELKYLICFSQDGQWPQTLMGLFTLKLNMDNVCKSYGEKTCSRRCLWSSTEICPDGMWFMLSFMDPDRYVCPKNKRFGARAFHRF